MRILPSIIVSLSLLVAASAHAQSSPEATMLARINELRAAQGLSALARDSRLDSAARVHTEEMAGRGELMHVSETTGTPIDRTRAVGLEPTDVAENVAMHHTIEEAQASLEASAPHLTNMLGPRATHIGLSAISTASGLYVTQLFAHLDVAEPEPAVAPAAPDVAAPVAPPAATEPAVAPEPPQSVAAAPVAPPVAPAPGGGTAIVVPPDPSGVIRVPAPAPGVTGYWICAANASGGRWYYYPVRAGYSGPLSPDLSVTGAPPGHSSACTTSSATAPAAVAPPAAAPPGSSRVLITPWGSLRVETRR